MPTLPFSRWKDVYGRRNWQESGTHSWVLRVRWRFASDLGTATGDSFHETDDQNTQATDPQEHEWMERVNIGTIPSAYQHQLVELLRSHQQVSAQDDDDVGLTQTVKHRIYTTDDNPF